MLGVVRMVVLLPIRGLKLEVRVDILPVWGVTPVSKMASGSMDAKVCCILGEGGMRVWRGWGVTPVSTMASGSIEERVCEECVIN